MATAYKCLLRHYRGTCFRKSLYLRVNAQYYQRRRLNIKYRTFSSIPSDYSNGNGNGNNLLDNVTSIIGDTSQQSTDNSKMESIINEIRNLDPFVIDDKLSLASCHFMIIYHQTVIKL